MIKPMAVLFTLLCGSVVAHAEAETSRFTKQVLISYSGAHVEVKNNAGDKVKASAADGQVSIVSTEAGVEYVLSGKSADGALNIESSEALKVTLKGVELTNADGPSLYVSSPVTCVLNITTGTENHLSDGSKYDKTFSAALYTKGALILEGSGALELIGNGQKKHALCSDMDVVMRGGNIVVTQAAKDGVHAGGDFLMEGGALKIAAAGDAVDVNGRVEIIHGKLLIKGCSADSKGIKSESVNIQGGEVKIASECDQYKAIKTSGDFLLQDGQVALILAGGVVLEPTEENAEFMDPDYSKAIDCGGNLSVSGGALSIQHSGMAGKAIVVEGNANVSGGAITLNMTGSCTERFKNEEGQDDIAAADAFKVKGNLDLLSGTVQVSSTGNAGDGISAGGTIVIGESGKDEPIVHVTVEGAQVLVSAQSQQPMSSDQQRPEMGRSQGRPMMIGGPGGEGNYANPKAIKAEGDVVINCGTVQVETSRNGAEGIESKSALTINGGTIEVTAFDDCINAVKKITVNDGMVYCYSIRNDGIDCNGPLEFNGGVVVSSGTTMPEEGFDCDQNPFTIHGGILVGTGGGTSTPLNDGQRSIIYSGEGTEGTIIQFKTKSGTLLAYRLPRTYAAGQGGGFAPPDGMEPPNDSDDASDSSSSSSSTSSTRRGGPPGGFGGGPGGFGGGPGGFGGAMTLLFSSPDIVKGAKCTMLSGGTIQGGTEFHGLYIGATVSGGKEVCTFTVSDSSTVSYAGEATASSERGNNQNRSDRNGGDRPQRSF